jgi:hypothetical protein
MVLDSKVEGSSDLRSIHNFEFEFRGSLQAVTDQSESEAVVRVSSGGDVGDGRASTAVSCCMAMPNQW